MTPNELISRYLSGEIALRKSVVFRIMKSTMRKAAMRFRDIIDLHLESVSEVEPIWSEIAYTYFYADKKEIFYARKSMSLINYIAADYGEFSMELVRQFMVEIDLGIKDRDYCTMAKNIFVASLRLNKKLPKEVKLWLRLN